MVDFVIANSQLVDRGFGQTLQRSEMNDSCVGNAGGDKSGALVTLSVAFEQSCHRHTD